MRNDLFYGVVAFAYHVGNNAFHAVRHHNFVQNNGCFLHGTHYVACNQFVADLSHGDKVPLAVSVHAVYFDTAPDTRARLLHEDVQRTLNTVKNTFDKSRSKLHRQGRARAYDFVADLQSACFLVDLNAGFIAAQFDYFADKLFVGYLYNVVHFHVGKIFRNDQRSADLCNSSYHLLSSLLNRISTPMAFSTSALMPAIPKPLLLPSVGIGTIAGKG